MNEPKYKRDQKLIDVESAAMQIAGFLYRYHEAFSCEVAITSDVLMTQMDLDLKELLLSKEWLHKRGWIEVRGDNHFSTKAGRQAYREAVESPEFVTGQSAQEFKREAVTGCTEDGKQSELEAAVIPSTQSRGYRSPEDEAIAKCEDFIRLKSTAARLHLSVGDTLSRIEDGSVRFCPQCRRLALFHRCNGRRGQKFQSACVDCKKRKRKHHES